VGCRFHLYPVSLDVVGAVGASGEVGQVELDLIPAAVEAHWQHAAERVNASRALVVAGAEPTSNVLVVKDLHQPRRPNVVPITNALAFCLGMFLLWLRVPD